ncbi:hypothetical protein PanWU01x14_205030 [Parasponia andersonii]|uniref:Uncharacterized protein n=1 Tax=Parasponia andersonii TaxID=3476 RepID=A0A2P5BWF1_PARAD|nr:hypothetical protein PanWU01x14_205030 [Parasponia andersonii]
MKRESSVTWHRTISIPTNAKGFVRFGVKSTLVTRIKALGTVVGVRNRIIHLKAHHQGLPKQRPILQEFSRHRLQNRNFNTLTAFYDCQNWIERNRTHQEVRIAKRRPIISTLKLILWLHS